MMKRYFNILLACFIAQAMYAQEPIVKWGEPVDEPAIKEAKIQKIMLTDEPGSFYVYRKTEGFVQVQGNWLEKYDQSNNFVYSKEIPSAEGVWGNGILFRKILPLKDRFLLFYSGYNKATKESSYIARVMSSNGDIDKTDIKLESFTAEKGSNPGLFDVAVSPDKTKLLLLTTFPEVKEQKAKLRLRVFDTQTMKELGTKEIELGFDSKKGCETDMLVDNTGNAYVVERYVSDKKKFEFNLYTYNLTSGEWKENPLDMGEKTISEQRRFMFTSSGDILFAGFLFTKVEMTPTGLFYVRVNTKTQAIEANAKPGYGDVAKREKEDASFSYYKLRGIEAQANGNVLIISEREEATNVPSTAPQGPQSSGQIAGHGGVNYDRQFNTTDIKVACIKPDGTRAWIRTIDKREKCTTPDNDKRWDSFVYGCVNDRLYILYNNTQFFGLDLTTGILNGWKEADGSVHHSKDFAPKTLVSTFLYVVEPNGDLTFSDKKYGLPLYSFQKGIFFNMNLNTPFYYPLPDGILMMDVMPDGKKYQFGKINF